MKHTSQHMSGVFAFAVAAVLAAACGSPAPKTSEFVFTPVPYTVLPAEPGETPVVVALDEDGSRYVEGGVVASLPRDDLSDFVEWLEDAGLEWERIDTDRGEIDKELGINDAILFVRVPLGTATQARDLIRSRPEVASADLNYLRAVH